MPEPEGFTFVENMPQSALDAANFQDMSPEFQAAVVWGVEKGLDMMARVAEAAELEDGAARSEGAPLSLDAVRQTQKILADSVGKWGDGILNALQSADPERDALLAGEIVYALIRAVKPKRLATFLETMTVGGVADVFTVQRFVVKSIERFICADRAYPGFDAKTPILRIAMLRRFLFEAACRRARQTKGLSVDRFVKEEARAALQSNHRDSLGALLKRRMNGLLAQMPDPSELKPRIEVNDFTADGIHAYFIRDCIARRCSFAIEGRGRLKNAHDREQEVAGGRRELEFYEKRLQEAEKQFELTGTGDPSNWKRPDVRASASMTKEDLRAACDAVMLAIPDPVLRQAVTAIANLSVLDLATLFFGKDPAAGILLEGNHRHMDMTFSPDAVSLNVDAMLFHDGVRAVERSEKFETEIELSKSSFTQLDYTVLLRRQKPRDGKNGSSWRVNKVVVNIAAPYLVAADAPDEEKRPEKRSGTPA